MTLFDAGRISSLSDQAHAAYDAAAAGYRQTVLAAYRDVEDNLAALRYLKAENTSAHAAAVAAEHSLAQENSLYSGGAATYIDVATAQNTAQQADLADIAVRVSRLTASVRLVKALGGGWSSADLQKQDEPTDTGK